MSRCIDADELLEQIRKKLGIKSLDYLLEAERQIVDAIQSAPSIDIVRCSECIFDTEYYFKNDIEEHRYEWCYEFCDVDGYCPFGKKRSEREDER